MASVDEHFIGKADGLRALYDRLVALADGFGPVVQEPKKTSIHLNRTTAFAGVAVRKGHLVLTVKSDRPFDSPRVVKSEQTSARRFHHEVRLSEMRDLDAELRGWLKAAYELSE
ncbi:MAG TPA: DUF5655 domain-containing protein [Gemmataceae bacterium]|jgi:hypothetical protein